jgi:superoxide dismutase, Cu-Zn family
MPLLNSAGDLIRMNPTWREGGTMRWMGYFVRSSVAGAVWMLPACEQEDRAGRDQQSRAPVAEALRARATVTGSGIEGTVTFAELKGNPPVPGVKIEARITGQVGDLTPGSHGFHIHENARGGCVPPYTSAGGHFDPGPSGNPDPDVNHPFHLGDIPNLVVDEKGVGTVEALTSRITLSPGPLSIFDADGSVVIVHGKPDQGIAGPPKSGVSGGPRIACGVIKLLPD